MDRTLIKPIIDDFPSEYRDILKNSKIYDSSCSTEARVFYIDKDNGYFLKHSSKGALKNEALMYDYFHSKGLSSKVISYITGDTDWLLSAAVKGEDCTHRQYLDDPKRLCDTLAKKLRELHSMDFSDCPIQDKMDCYFSVARENFEKGSYDLSYFMPDGKIRDNSSSPLSAADVFTLFENNKNELKSDTLLHGDYCLPNIILDNWDFSGFIDLGNGGVGDRHIDIFWGAWTLSFNLKTDKYRERFYDAYGRDIINTDLLTLVSCAEVFG